MATFCKTILTAVFALSLLLFTPVSAGAHHGGAVVDKYGKIVRDIYGHCVMTKWEDSRYMCDELKLMLDERTVHFAFDSAVLEASEKAKLDRLARLFEEHKIERVKMVGYTDPIGDTNYNLKLSKKRAQAVKKYFDETTNLDSRVAEIRGLGEADQVKSCKGMRGRELIKCLRPNRRVEVEVDYYGYVY